MPQPYQWHGFPIEFSSEEIKRFVQMGRANFGVTSNEKIDLKFALNYYFVYIRLHCVVPCGRTIFSS